MKALKSLSKNHLILIGAALVLSLVSFSNVLLNLALDFLSNISDKMLLSLGIAIELKSLAASIADYKIPLIQSSSNEISEVFDKTIQYLTLSNILIAVQITLTAMGKTLFFKLVPLVFLAGMFFNKYRKMSSRLLIIALMVNPGLSIYVNGINLVSKSLQLNLGISLHNDLNAIKTKYDAKMVDLKQSEADRRDKQLAKAKGKGKDDIGMLTKIEDGILDKSSEIVVRSEEGVKMLLRVLKDGKKQILQMTINLVSNLLVLFVLLPLLYFYIVSFVLKKYFHFSMLKELDKMEEENFEELEDKLIKSK